MDVNFHCLTVPSLRSASVREQLAASASAAVSVAPNPGPGVPRSLFGRLGIRKPSILSLTSPHASGYSPATARTFSLDDLLKPPPRRKAECQNRCVNFYIITYSYLLTCVTFRVSIFFPQTIFYFLLYYYYILIFLSLFFSFSLSFLCLKLFVVDLLPHLTCIS